MSRKYSVLLTAHGNIDHGEDPNALVFPVFTFYVDSIEECQELVRNYISEAAIGAGSWTGGEVRELATGKVVGNISYNGRFWPTEAK